MRSPWVNAALETFVDFDTCCSNAEAVEDLQLLVKVDLWQAVAQEGLHLKLPILAVC